MHLRSEYFRMSSENILHCVSYLNASWPHDIMQKECPSALIVYSSVTCWWIRVCYLNGCIKCFLKNTQYAMNYCSCITLRCQYAISHLYILLCIKLTFGGKWSQSWFAPSLSITTKFPVNVFYFGFSMNIFIQNFIFLVKAFLFFFMW